MQGEVAGVGIQMLFLDRTLPENKMFHTSLPVNCGTVAQRGCAPGNVREACFDSCNSSSLIPHQVLRVMVCIQRLALSDVQGWLMVGVKRQKVL